MLALFGKDEAIRNIYKLVKTQNPTSQPGTISQLRPLYLDFLDSRQRGIKVNRGEDVFVENAELENVLSSAFCIGSLNDLDQSEIIGPRYDDATRQLKSNIAAEALASIMDLDEDFAIVFSLAIHAVFVRPSRPMPGGIRGSHGGSSSAAIGSIWLTVMDKVRPIDLMEMFVHELTHHLLFIDELNHPQFNYGEIAKSENFAHSAILRKHRPLDKVIHSIVVATEILAARRRYLRHDGETVIHPPTDAMAQEILTSIRSVEALPNLDALVTPHLRSVVQRCELACRDLWN
jgi:hypothetical protein